MKKKERLIGFICGLFAAMLFRCKLFIPIDWVSQIAGVAVLSIYAYFQLKSEDSKAVLFMLGGLLAAMLLPIG